MENDMSKELKIGDEVRVTTDAYTDSFPRGSVGMVVDVGRGFIGAAFNGEYGNDGYPLRLDDGEYEPTVSDEAEGVKLWRDMSDEEKGALLLAHHEGKVIEVNTGHGWHDITPTFTDSVAYRVKPGPVRETVGLYAGLDRKRHPLPIGTIDLIDGKPDRDSIKMESAT